MESVRTLTVDGLSYTYRSLRPAESRTEPLVALGGAFQGMYDWPQLEDDLTGVADLVTADLPGSGDSDLPRPEHTLEILDAALDAIVDDLRLPRINLYGYSYGAVLAFRYAQRHPERCARLLLGGVPAHLSEAPFTRYRQAGALLRAGDAEGFVTQVTAEMFCLDESRHVHRRELALRYFRRSLLKTCRQPHAPYLLERALGTRTSLMGGLTGVPTLVFAGEHDTLTTPDLQRAFASTIDGSDFVTIADCDHMMLLERPDAVTHLITSFITDNRSLSLSCHVDGHFCDKEHHRSL
ncbi:alpha/beta hydrolase [Streptomyces sp. NPDC051214]|uniref:alpha/beta fold hydrolase n=1 Tax=Streptomyces sp. NPDC051214 TaxID=3155282 RepID=UPI003423E269